MRFELPKDDGILASVPVISIFFGIVIRMYYKEHEPRYCHAEHQAHEGKFDFDGNQIGGNITSANALALIGQWAHVSWGVRAQTADRVCPWTHDELLAMLPGGGR